MEVSLDHRNQRTMEVLYAHRNQQITMLRRQDIETIHLRQEIQVHRAIAEVHRRMIERHHTTIRVVAHHTEAVDLTEGHHTEGHHTAEAVALVADSF